MEDKAAVLIILILRQSKWYYHEQEWRKLGKGPGLRRRRWSICIVLGLKRCWDFVWRCLSQVLWEINIKDEHWSLFLMLVAKEWKSSWMGRKERRKSRSIWPSPGLILCVYTPEILCTSTDNECIRCVLQRYWAVWLLIIKIWGSRLFISTQQVSATSGALACVCVFYCHI